MEVRNATLADFDAAFAYIEKLWTYNNYDKAEIRNVYQQVLANENDFAFFLFDGNQPVGFCHGTYFNTFWTSGLLCYVSSLIVDEECRGKGYARNLMDKAKELAQAKHCTAIVLDSGLPREAAHKFYEKYGFAKSAYCFYLKL